MRRPRGRLGPLTPGGLRGDGLRTAVNTAGPREFRQIIEAKRADRALPEAPEPKSAPVKMLDLMAALREAVSKVKASREVLCCAIPGVSGPRVRGDRLRGR